MISCDHHNHHVWEAGFDSYNHGSTKRWLEEASASPWLPVPQPTPNKPVS